MLKNNHLNFIADAIYNNRYYITEENNFTHNCDNPMFVDFQNSWNRLVLDNYMNDGGKYRYRRYSVINCNDEEIHYLPPEPHFQTLDYNLLNGGIHRPFESIEDCILKSVLLKSTIINCAKIFSIIDKNTTHWRVECHQFRILTMEDQISLPTPEGKHRDGVDFVFMMLINRKNVEGGVSKIYDGEELLSSYTLKHSMASILLDDRKAMHEVTKIEKLSSSIPEAYRDMLVLTFRKKTN